MRNWPPATDGTYLRCNEKTEFEDDDNDNRKRVITPQPFPLSGLKITVCYCSS